MNRVTFRFAQMGITIVLKNSLLRVDEVTETREHTAQAGMDVSSMCGKL